MIIDTFQLCITLGHQKSFITLYGANRAVFDFINPATSNQLFSRRVRDQVWLAAKAANSDCIAACHCEWEATSVYERGSTS